MLCFVIPVQLKNKSIDMIVVVVKKVKDFIALLLELQNDERVLEPFTNLC